MSSITCELGFLMTDDGGDLGLGQSCLGVIGIGVAVALLWWLGPVFRAVARALAAALHWLGSCVQAPGECLGGLLHSMADWLNTLFPGA